MSEIQWSFLEVSQQDNLPVGTLACAFQEYPYGSYGKIIKVSTLKEIEAEGYDISEVSKVSKDSILYLFEFKNGRKNDYIWPSNIFPVPLEQ